jgi:hypothetical protein
MRRSNLRKLGDTIPCEISPVPSPTVTTSRSPYAGEFFGAAFPGYSRLPWPSLSLTSSALPCSPLRANLSTLPCNACIAIHFMLRAAVLLSFLRGLQHFSTASHPEARLAKQARCLLRACLTITATGLSPASRRRLSGHTSECWAAKKPFVLYRRNHAVRRRSLPLTILVSVFARLLATLPRGIHRV